MGKKKNRNSFPVLCHISMRLSKTWKPSLLCSVCGHKCPQLALGPRRLSVLLGDHVPMALMKEVEKPQLRAHPRPRADVCLNPASATRYTIPGEVVNLAKALFFID